MRLPVIAIATALVSLACVTAQAQSGSASGQLYQWKDARGVTHYSQHPPPRGAYQTRTVRQRDPQPQQSTAAASSPPSSTCERARASLTLLQSDQPVRLEGQQTALTPQQRQSQTELAQAAVRVHCDSAN